MVIILAVSLLAATASGGPSGFGTGTRGGHGGRIVKVTNLDPAGPDSLRAALEAKGPRIVVFETGGVINLAMKRLVISEPFLTVAGETAPPPGITIIRGGVRIETHDVIVRHLRVRPGDAGRPKRSGWEPDGISTDGAEAHDIIVEHCSIAWAVDENLSASGPRAEGPEATSRRVTFRDCIVAEGLDDSSHGKGRHSKGSLIHDFCREIVVTGNLYAHNVRRNPYFKAHTTGFIVNNVIYNPGARAIELGYVESDWEGTKYGPGNCRVVIAGNVLIHGPDTKRGLALVRGRGDAYLEDNLALGRSGEPAGIAHGDVTILKARPFWPPGVEPLPAAETLEHVLRNAGARPDDRDETDARIVRQVRERGGRIINSQEEVGGYPH